MGFVDKLKKFFLGTPKPKETKLASSSAQIPITNLSLPSTQPSQSALTSTNLQSLSSSSIPKEESNIESLKIKVDLIISQIENLKVQYDTLNQKIDSIERMTSELYKMAKG